MKHLLAILVALIPLPAFGFLTVEQGLGPLSLALFEWDNPNPPGLVGGFNLYLGDESGVYDPEIDTGLPFPDESGVYHYSIEIDAVFPTYAAMTAYAEDQESDFSNEVVRDPCEGNPDFDGDGFCDRVDNCIEIANETQCDGDGDGYGNACDADFNQDGITSILDFGILATKDPIADMDCNGTVGALDFGLFSVMYGKAPGPSGWYQ